MGRDRVLFGDKYPVQVSRHGYTQVPEILLRPDLVGPLGLSVYEHILLLHVIRSTDREEAMTLTEIARCWGVSSKSLSRARARLIDRGCLACVNSSYDISGFFGLVDRLLGPVDRTPSPPTPRGTDSPVGTPSPVGLPVPGLPVHDAGLPVPLPRTPSPRDRTPSPVFPDSKKKKEEEEQKKPPSTAQFPSDCASPASQSSVPQPQPLNQTPSPQRRTRTEMLDVLRQCRIGGQLRHALAVSLLRSQGILSDADREREAAAMCAEVEEREPGADDDEESVQGPPGPVESGAGESEKKTEPTLCDEVDQSIGPGGDRAATGSVVEVSGSGSGSTPVPDVVTDDLPF